MNLKSRLFAFISVFLALTMVLVIAPASVFVTADTPGIGNTGYEAWYHYIGDVVNAANGNLFFRAKDTSIKARGFNLEIIRSYNSLNNEQDSPFGFGWTHNYNIRLTGTGNMTFYDADGSVYTFTDSGGGSYASPAGLRSKLTKNLDESFTLWHKDGSKYNFSSTGVLQNIVDKNDNALNFTYAGANLTTIADSSGLALTLSYSGSKVSSVVDPLGREIHYSYNGGNLSQVTDALSKSTLYYYNANHLLRSAINRFGGMVNFQYTGKKVVEISNSIYDGTTGLPVNRIILYSISYGQGVTVATDVRGYQTITQLNANGNPINIYDPLGGITSFSWDASMNKTGYTDANGNAYVLAYDSLGNITSEKDPLNRYTYWLWNNINDANRYISLRTSTINARNYSDNFEYDAKGNLIQMTNALSKISYATYDSSGNRISYTDFKGKVTNYTYDTHGNRTTKTDPLSSATTYTYDTVGRLLSETDGNGHTTTYEYDANDRMVKETNDLGGETRHFYNEEGSLVKTIDPAGRVTEYSHNLGGSVNKVTDAAGNEVSHIYDANGNLLSTTDARGGIAGMTYDALGRLTSTTDALGNTESYTYDRAGNRLCVTDKRGNTTTYEYNAVSMLVKETDALANQTSYQYDAVDNRTGIVDAKGNTTAYQYDATNRITRITQAGVVICDVTYDNNSNISTLKDARNNTTSYQYDFVNRRTRVTDPLGSYETTAYDAVGNKTSVTDRRGNVTTYQYDALNRLTGTTDALANTTTLTYDAVGNLTGRTDAAGNVTSYEYDTLGRRTKQTEATGAITLYGYDSLGNLTSQTDANGNAVTYQYDALNRLIKETDALGKQTNHQYDAVGNRTRTTDANGNITNYQYDAINRLLKQTDALGNQTSFAYDGLGNVTTLTDAKGNVTGYQYDAFSRLTKITSALGHETTYTYDGEGNTLTRTDAVGSVTNYTYDALNRLTEIAYPDTSKVSYTYDAEGNNTRIASTGGAGETTDHTYNALNRILSSTVNYGAFQKTIAYTYNSIGKRATMTDPSGGVTSYAYDSAGKPLTITDPSGGIASYGYDAAGRRTRITSPNGVIATYTYDAADRLLSVVSRKTDNTVISSFTYSYDHVGNRLSMTEAGGDVTSYVYDAIYRLTRVTNPSGAITNYTYDAAGNRLSEDRSGSVTTYTYDADNRMLTSGATNYTYDNRGNQLSKAEGGNTTAYQYNYENRLTRVTFPDSSQLNYQYAPYGDRLSRIDSVGTTFYFYDINDLLVEMDNAGAVQARYTHGSGIDEPITVSRGGVAFYYHFDGLGSVALLSGVDQGTVASYKYDAFGAITQQTGSIVSPYRFAGREYESASGLYYLRARYYDPQAGRFLSKDPWGATLDEINQYVYARNNPVNMIDLFGGSSGYIRFDGRRYSLDEYDEACLRRAYEEFSRAWEEMEREVYRMERELNNMLRRMRNEARERCDRSFMHALISTYIGTAVGALVGALTLNPVLGALAGTAACTAYNAAVNGEVTGTDAAQGTLGTIGSIAGNFAGSLASTVNLYWSARSAESTLDEELDRINQLAERMQRDWDQFVRDLSREVKNVYHNYAEQNCRIRKEPPYRQTPVTTTGDRVVTGIPTGERGYGGRTTEGTRHNDLAVRTRSYIDPVGIQVPIEVTITNQGLCTPEGWTLDTKVYSPPESRTILLVVDESRGSDYYYRNAMDNLDIDYETVNVDTQYTPVYEDTNPDTKDLKDYNVVIWECSYDTTGTLEGVAQAELKKYLDNHGCLAVFGSGIMYQWQASTGTLMGDRMFADGYGKKFQGAVVDGVPNTIGDGFHFEMASYRNNYSIKNVKVGGQPFFLYRGGFAGIQADTGQYKAVLSTVTIDYQNMSLQADRDAFMGKLLGFLDCRYRHPGEEPPPEEPPEIPPLTPGETTRVPVTVTVPPGRHTVVTTLSEGTKNDNNPGNDSATTIVYTKSGGGQPPTQWTFDSPTGQPQQSGVGTNDDSLHSLSRIHCPNPYNAYPYSSFSWWCGCEGTDWLTGTVFVSGYGYGNNWNEFLDFPNVAIPQGADPWLSFVIRYDTELNKDITYVEAFNSTTSQWQSLAQFSGNSQGWVEGLAYEIPDGLFSPFKLRFHFISDGQNSDEDGLYDSDGAFWVDNIKVYDHVTNEVFYYNNGMDYPEQEVGDRPWGVAAQGAGDYWQLYQHNGSWQWACFDPATGVWAQNLVDQLIFPVIDITGYNRPCLYYDADVNLPATSTDSLWIVVSTNGGQTWNFITSLGGTWGDPAPVPVELTQYKSTTFRLMFEADGWGTTHTWGVYLDNVTIKEYTPPEPPVASFTSSPASPLVNQVVTFDASASNDADGTIASYHWDFGDGTTADGMNVTHSYSSPWYYPATLTVTDSDGFTDSEFSEIPVALTLVLVPPAITALNPDHGNKGATLSVVISGSNLSGATAVSFGAGITVNSFTVNSSSQITANVTINAAAATGTRDVSVTTPGGTYALTGGFTVAAAPVIAGDANGDGNINALDITKVERVIAELDPQTPGADANQDGSMNALDITTVERKIAGLV